MPVRAWTVRWVPGCVAVGSVALIGAGLALAYVDRHLVPASLTNWTFSSVSGQVVNVAVPVTGFVLASRRLENRIGWLFLVAGLGLGLAAFSNPYAVHALVVGRGSLPAGRLFGWVSNWIWSIPVAMLAFLFLLFPTGRLRSRRWRPAAWLVGGAFALATVGAVRRRLRRRVRRWEMAPVQRATLSAWICLARCWLWRGSSPRRPPCGTPDSSTAMLRFTRCAGNP